MTKLNKRRLVKLKQVMHQHSALLLALVIFLQVAWPTQMMALTGGPSQPEVQSFEPVGTSDMVDAFTGDFNYNLPLLDVEGYPINISYHSGINTDQEASWVGLGWNINPGVINRNMRGIPDDFAGDNVVKTFNMKPNKTWGVAVNGTTELFGNNRFNIGLSGSFGFNYNNYAGPTVIKSFNVNISASVGGGGRLNAGLGLSSSSDDGLTVQPSLGFSETMNTSNFTETTLGLSVGTSFNSRGGLKQLTIGASASSSIRGDYVPKITSSKNDQGVTLLKDEGGSHASGSLGSVGASGTFNFGQPTYTPKIDMPMKNFSMSGNFTLGGVVFGLHGKIGLSGFYSGQELATNSISSPAYGYLYSEKGQMRDNALMDFNREKDGTFTESTPSLPLTNLTFDTYGVSGQGIGGSYRPFRGDIGYVFDASSYTTNDDDALTIEVGLGGYAHVGTNVTVIDVYSQSGKWKSDNAPYSSLRYTPKGDGTDFENVYFKEANEKGVDSDPTFYQNTGSDNPVRFDVNLGRFDHQLKNGFVDQNGTTLPFSGPIQRKARDKKTQNISFLKYGDYNNFAIDNSYTSQLSSAAQPHHIAEVTTLGVDGSRYVYGVAAYNTTQKEITFSVGSTLLGSHDNNLNIAGCETSGLVIYGGNDNTFNNSKGLDNYYSSTQTPGYAHSYLLTAVLTPDYIDADGIRGPSSGDFGGYTKFKYQKVANFGWRVPFDSQKATFTEGLKSDYTDDKANIMYGQKDLFYLDTVMTKNYFAVFHKSARQDGYGVLGENGGINTGVPVMKLDSISLYSKRDLTKPIKRVHFTYSYDLCQGIPNNSAYPATGAGTGKLTLKSIYFTYQNSLKAKLSPYTFDYHETTSAENPLYNIKAYDRWGNYKPSNNASLGVQDVAGMDAASFVSAALKPTDYPYVDQSRTVTDVYAAVWNLKAITLPSGGIINITYEADDYNYVQNKPAAQMYKIINYVTDTSSANLTSANVDQSNTQIADSTASGFFIFAASPGVPNIQAYSSGLQYVYFRFLKYIRITALKPYLEYVSGYGEFKNLRFIKRGGVYYGALSLKDVNLKDDNTGSNVNPVVKAGINFGRLHLPKVVWNATAANFSGTLSGSIVSAMINSSFIKNIRDAVTGPNQSLFKYYGVAKYFVGAKAWVRLNCPTGHKLGGGCRVQQIQMSDNWQGMAGGGSNGENTNYGQVYNYNLRDGTSSGVAAYEPQLGGDENPFKQPIFSTTKKLLVPDDKSYVEEPFGECFFPSASVGYSRITVRNLPRNYVGRHATGSVVHEFYTAKDFPTITNRTGVTSRRGQDGPGSLHSLLKIDVRDYFAATQGFVVEVNDMHGKPKAESVYQQGDSTAISSVSYNYQKQNYLNGAFKLVNTCQTIDKAGNISNNNLGMFFDMVGDLRESTTNTDTKSLALNVDIIPIWGLGIPIPGIWPGYANNNTRFRSATLTKVVQRFGILQETVSTDLGSTVSQKNIGYDATTGGVLMSQTTTDYNDTTYSFKYPAWWYYDLMGGAYQNLGFEQSNVLITGGGANLNSAYLFQPGDEVALRGALPNNNVLAWVYSVSGNTVNFILKNGTAVNNDTYSLKILRSGRKNNLTTDMATITTLSNPKLSLSNNAYQNVLQASATEFYNKRKTHCDCFSANTTLPNTSNPYVNGTRGIWRPLKAYTYLTTRSQSNTNANTNIRRDGVFEAYTPFFKLNAGAWQTDPNNWTYVSQVTEFNVFGEEVEDQDALGRYSSASFGYNQTMALSVAANTQFKEQGFDGFEDYRFNPCIDDHFKLATNDTSTAESHTGKYSLKVSSGTPKYYYKQIALSCTTVPDCNLLLTPTYTSGTPHLYSVGVTNGTAPYSFSFTILSGATSSPQCSANGATFTSTAPGPYRISVTVTDANGCRGNVTLNAL